MYRFWNGVIEPLLTAAGAGRIVEIGCGHGRNTRSLLEYCRRNGGFLQIADPDPRISVEAVFAEYAGCFSFRRARALSCLWEFRDYDAVLISGDENWYTVISELRMIRKNTEHFPLVFVHGTSWPYDRRDRYAAPEAVPEQYRHAYEKKGIDADTNELADEGGYNAQYANSVDYNNQGCGVLTAVEDFVRENDGAVSAVCIPFFNGLGILYETDRAWPEEFEDLIRRISVGEPVESLMIEADKSCAKAETRYYSQRKRTERLQEEFDRMREKHRKELAAKDAEMKKAVVEARQEEKEKLRREIDQTERRRAEADQLRREADQGRIKAEQDHAKALQEKRGVEAKLAAEQKRLAEEHAKFTGQIKKLDAEKTSFRKKAERFEKESNDRLNSIHYRIGGVFIDAMHSPAAFVKMPVRLAKLYRDGKRQNSGAAKPAAAVQTQEKAPEVQKSAPATPAKASFRKALLSKEEILGRNLELIPEKGLRDFHDKVSFIIVNHDGLENLKVLFASLERCKFYGNYEIIVVDNASSDGSVGFLREQQEHFDLKILVNEQNESFSKANNQGAEAAEGEYLLFLNNDIEVTDWFLDEMLRVFLTKENVGAVGAKLVYPEIPATSINAGKSWLVQHAGIHFRQDNFEGQPMIRPFNYGNTDQVFDPRFGEVREFAAVTAACKLVKRSVFYEVLGYEEAYSYGMEDVDLSLKMHRAGYHNYVAPTALLFHYEFGTQSTNRQEEVQTRRRNNNWFFFNRWNRYLAKSILEDKISRTRCFTDEPLTVAFAVTEAGKEATAGDYFTAEELGEYLHRAGAKIIYLCRRGPGDWYNVGSGVDVLVSMLDAYEPAKMTNTNPQLITIAWARNWFERWCTNPSLDQYTILMASSEKACEYMKGQTGREIVLFRLGTNNERFEEIADSPENPRDEKKFRCDYVFTGSYWNQRREIQDIIHPEDIPYRFNIFGKNWEQTEEFADYTKGFLNYDDIPYVYKYSKIVVDDANGVTIKYGSVNSRVYDAIASGCLVLTNGTEGAASTFNGMLPTYRTREEFREKLVYYLEHEEERQALVAKLQEFVLENHTYGIRAKQLLEILREKTRLNDHKIAIMCPVPRWREKEAWGDYHFSIALQKYFERRGFETEIRIRPDWNKPFDGKYVLVLRGVVPYQVKPEHINLMWNISHPEDIPDAEFEEYDGVFVSSVPYAEKLAARLRVPVMPLLQCTDPELFKQDAETIEKKYELLFVGNTRAVFREVIQDVLTPEPLPYRLSVFGQGWNKYIDSRYICGENIRNAQLGKEYAASEILLNDHWKDMREQGFISNRLFDGLAAGAFIISDPVEGAEALDGGFVTYENREDLRSKITYYMAHPDERKEIARRGQEAVLGGHSFENRVDEILKFLDGYGMDFRRNRVSENEGKPLRHGDEASRAVMYAAAPVPENGQGTGGAAAPGGPAASAGNQPKSGAGLIKGGIQCCKDHGIPYTVMYMFDKFRK